MNAPSPRTPGLYYQVKGLPDDDAQHMVDHIASDPSSCSAPWPASASAPLKKPFQPLVSASSGALSTAVGASIPLFLLLHDRIDAVIAAAVISLAAHFAVGAAKSLITVRSWCPPASK